MATTQTTPFEDFVTRLTHLVAQHPSLITTTLSNIFTMRLVGNKTHGDLAEIAIAEFVNQYMYDFSSEHVGKDMYRAKSHEEDIKVINDITKSSFPISLKAYGNGPLQLSTDKSFGMFPRLQSEGTEITSEDQIAAIFDDPVFQSFVDINVLPLIYDEKQQTCNIMVFDYKRARHNTKRIELASKGSGRKHPVYRFYDGEGHYICEVRYGGTTANALQRGLWTHTKHAAPYFDSVTNGWITYSHSQLLVRLFSRALVCSDNGHVSAIECIDTDIKQIKKKYGLPHE